MAEEKKEEIKEQNEKVDLPDNLGPAVMQPDLGPVANALADEMPEDERSEEEKEAGDNAAKNPIPEDPTKGMSPSEEKQYWLKRANHFEKEYQVERAKRQTYDKKYGGLTGGLNDSSKTNGDPRGLNHDDLPFEVPSDIQDLKSYTRFIIGEAHKGFRHILSEEKLDERVESTEVQARETHTGDDGWPPYDEVIDEFVVPFIKKRPAIFTVLRQLPDPAEASYTLGIMLKYPHLKDMIGSQARDDVIKNINKTAKQAATVQGRNSGHSPSGKLTKADIEAMTPEQFEVELEKFRGGA